MTDYNNALHTCTAVDCRNQFVVEGKQGMTSAHHLLYLHAKKQHGTKIDFACHAKCQYLVLS